MPKNTSKQSAATSPVPVGIPTVIPQNDQPCDGFVKVHESVLASIVRKATCSVKGVLRLAGSSFVDNIAEIVGSKKIYDRAIAIEMGENSVKIEVKIIVAYGSYIPDVAMGVQSAVISEITQITGMSVEKVNVLVMDLDELPQDDAVQNPQE